MKRNKNLDVALRYFIKHEDELIAKYPEKFVVIMGKQVVAVYEDFITAYEICRTEKLLGNVAIYQCVKGDAIINVRW